VTDRDRGVGAVRKPLPWEKVRSSQVRSDRLAELLQDGRSSGAQRQMLRKLITLQKAALRLRVAALGHAYKAGHVVRAAEAHS